jgi:hypothetical protein
MSTSVALPYLLASHLASLRSVLNPTILSSPPNLMANALASIAAKDVVISRTVGTER